ncbi:MAG: DUF1707 domain-containing protein [Actinomycetia bacterium]|nr:DUF1707 domain-containing protein [Actinomycetes bacterium]
MTSPAGYGPGGWPRVPGPSPRPFADPHAALRASNADRNRVADLVSQAYATGQLDDTELSSRLDATFAAKTLGDLVPITADLNFAALAPAVPAPVPAVPVRPRNRHVVAKVVAGLLAFVVVIGGGTGAVYGALHDWAPVVPGAGQHDKDSTNVYQGNASELPPAVTVTAGSAVLDLSRVTVDTDATMDISVTAGSATLRLPGKGNVVLTYDVAAGSLSLPQDGKDARTVDGISKAGTYTITPLQGGPTLNLRVHVAAGSLTVR